MVIGPIGEVGGVVPGHVVEAPVVDVVHAQTPPLETVDRNVQALPRIADRATQAQIAQVCFFNKLNKIKLTIVESTVLYIV